jgi:hypothetical protein
MPKPIQTDEMLYELLKELKADMNRQFGDMREQLRDTKTDVKGELSDLGLRLSTVAAAMEHIQTADSVGALGYWRG